MKKAVAISYNWLSQECFTSLFEGDQCHLEAEEFLEEIKDNYPASKGWVNFIYCNEEAAKERHEYLEAALEIYLAQGQRSH